MASMYSQTEKKPSVVTAQPHQVEPAVAILLDSILGHYFARPVALDMLTQAQASGHLIVALEDEAVVGFYVQAPRGLFLVFPYLHLLAVQTSKRGSGIGSALLAHLESQTLAAPGYPDRPKVFLLVAQDNPDAVRFYERQGYRRMAVIDDMFADGDTEFLMMKDLGHKVRALRTPTSAEDPLPPS